MNNVDLLINRTSQRIKEHYVKSVLGNIDIYDPVFARSNLAINIPLNEVASYQEWKQEVLREAIKLADFWSGVVNAKDFVSDKVGKGAKYAKDKAKEQLQVAKDASINIGKKAGAMAKIFWNITAGKGGDEMWLQSINNEMGEKKVSQLGQAKIKILKLIRAVVSKGPTRDKIDKAIKGVFGKVQDTVDKVLSYMSGNGWKSALIATGAALVIHWIHESVKKLIDDFKKFIKGEEPAPVTEQDAEGKPGKAEKILKFIEGRLIKAFQKLVKKGVEIAGKVVAEAAISGGWKTWWDTITTAFGGVKFVTDALTPAIKDAGTPYLLHGEIKDGLHDITVESRSKGKIMKISKLKLRRILRESYQEIISEGNASVDYMRGYEDAQDDLPKNPTDGPNGFYNVGYQDFLLGQHEEYKQLMKDQENFQPGVDWMSWADSHGLIPEFDSQKRLHFYVPYSGRGDEIMHDAERLGGVVEDSPDGRSYIIYAE